MLGYLRKVVGAFGAHSKTKNKNSEGTNLCEDFLTLSYPERTA